MASSTIAPNSRDERERLTSLDGLRGVAILLVMVFHLVLAYPFSAGANSLYYQLGGVGWIGVDLFFVLSGFLITGILLDTKGDQKFFSTFFIRRTLRIFPLYYFALAIIFIIAPMLGLYDTPELRFVLDRQIYFWTYMTNWGFVAARGARFFNVEWLALIHFWSLAVEEQFYLAWPFVVYLFSRSALVRVCIVLVVSALAFRVGIAALDLPQGAAYALTPARIDTLAIGALLAIAFRQEGAMRRVWAAAPWVAALALAFLVTVFALHQGVWFADRWMNTLGFSALAVGWGAVVSMCLPGSDRPGLRGALEVSWLRMFGKYSYGLYVLHHLLLPQLSPGFFAARFPETIGASLFILSSILLFLGAAWISWKLIESPFLKMKRFAPYSGSPSLPSSGGGSPLGKLGA